MHVLPQLEELEKRFPDTLAVIGVHSQKFPAEAEPENLRQAILRYDVRHPVVSDPDHVIWGQYAVSAWPTLVFVDPEGYHVGGHAGEFEADAFAGYISEMVQSFDRQGKLNRTRLDLRLEVEKEPDRELKFPGKVLADAESGRLFIADTGHNRILLCDLAGGIIAVVGSGESGTEDGGFEEASFHFPQGMALDGDLLYVADTWNHLIRRVDFARRGVKTVAGTGDQARRHRRGGPARSTDLSSPWDLVFVQGILYIAMAGSHQIWALDISGGEVHVFAGTGREALDDASLRKCALAQPSGLAFSGTRLYFADSESSAIRFADIETDKVETLVGAGLFEFGDRDGTGSEVRLQHCLGVAEHAGLLYVADTYNNKIKMIDPATKTCLMLLGKRAALWEPGGLSISGGKLYIADTNNHAIRTADLATLEVETLAIRAP